MSLILIASLICAAAILFAIEFIRFLRADTATYPDYRPGRLASFCLRHSRAVLLLTILWLVGWASVSVLIVVEFLTNSKAYL